MCEHMGTSAGSIWFWFVLAGTLTADASEGSHPGPIHWESLLSGDLLAGSLPSPGVNIK